MISVTVDPRNTFTAMTRFISRMGDRRNENRKVAIQFFSFVQRNFAQSGALVESGGWRPLAPSTIAQKKRLRYSSRPLLRTGALKNSFMMFSDNDQAGVGSGVEYSEYHEVGGRAGRPPQRKMLPPTRIAESMVTNVYGLKLVEAIRGSQL